MKGGENYHYSNSTFCNLNYEIKSKIEEKDVLVIVHFVI